MYDENLWNICLLTLMEHHSRVVFPEQMHFNQTYFDGIEQSTFAQFADINCFWTSYFFRTCQKYDLYDPAKQCTELKWDTDASWIHLDFDLFLL